MRVFGCSLVHSKRLLSKLHIGKRSKSESDIHRTWHSSVLPAWVTRHRWTHFSSETISLRKFIWNLLWDDFGQKRAEMNANNSVCHLWMKSHLATELIFTIRTLQVRHTHTYAHWHCVELPTATLAAMYEKKNDGIHTLPIWPFSWSSLYLISACDIILHVYMCQNRIESDFRQLFSLESFVWDEIHWIFVAVESVFIDLQQFACRQKLWPKRKEENEEQVHKHCSAQPSKIKK